MFTQVTIRKLKLTRISLIFNIFQVLINRIYEEADLDDDGMLSFAEFEHVISKSPDFSK